MKNFQNFSIDSILQFHPESIPQCFKINLEHKVYYILIKDIFCDLIIIKSKNKGAVIYTERDITGFLSINYFST